MKLLQLISEAEAKCPKPTQDIELNLKNRQKAIVRKQSIETNLKRNKSLSKLIWVHNGTVNKRILPDLLDEYQQNGFVRGQLIKKGKLNG